MMFNIIFSPLVKLRNLIWELGAEEELKIILLTKTVPVLAESQARDYGWLNKSKAGKLKRNRERSECETKMKRLGLVPIWLKQG